MFMPWLLVILGVLFLLENLGFLPWLNWSIIWPLVLIAAGLYMMKKKCREGEYDCCNWFKDKKEEKK